ncbi:hypothetical protein PR048_018791 [Dryococelus australis]|uniref:Uncharacterized protein n=1 Tax=Dryococelus australis TaxID=614101 RepID=A0ABQ9H1T0_9NEOP|nr:hypothetical protein PR048_018791 [Dryococelus australis]
MLQSYVYLLTPPIRCNPYNATYYNEEVRTWLRHSDRPLTPFDATGLYPVDRNIFSDHDFLVSDERNEHAIAAPEESQTDGTVVLHYAIENDLPSSRSNLKECVPLLQHSSCSNETSQQDTLTKDVSMPVQSEESQTDGTVVLHCAIENDLPSSRSNLKECVPLLQHSSCSNETSQQDTLTKDVSMPVQSILGTSNIQHMSAQRNSHRKLGNPVSATSRIIVPTQISPIPNIRSRKQQTFSTCRRGRKPVTCDYHFITVHRTNTERVSQTSVFIKEERCEKRTAPNQSSVPNESSSSAEELSVHDDSSDMEVEHNGTTPDSDDAVCIFCETKYSEDTQGFRRIINGSELVLIALGGNVHNKQEVGIGHLLLWPEGKRSESDGELVPA